MKLCIFIQMAVVEALALQFARIRLSKRIAVLKWRARYPRTWESVHSESVRRGNEESQLENGWVLSGAANQKSQAKARNKSQLWTQSELEFVYRSPLPISEIAEKLGRTLAGCWAMRYRLRDSLDKKQTGSLTGFAKEGLQ